MAERRSNPIQMKVTVIKESTDAEITERICKAYLLEEQDAIKQAVNNGFESLEPVWQNILIKHRKEIESAKNTN